MAVHRFLLTVAVSVFTFAAIARAEDTPGSPDVETAKHNFIGVINGSNVFVRSAPREDAYPTAKLDKGQKVTVVGMKFKWLKILPPEGSFAYVPKAYVNKRGDGKWGRASHESIAKVGSALNPLKTAPMGRIDDGQDVEILGDQDEYYKIKPPEGSFLYVNEAFVDPLKALPTAAEQKAQVIASNVTPKPATPEQPVAIGEHNEGAPPTTRPVTTETPLPGAQAAAPATQPAEPTAVAFEKLEADFKAANEKPITDQPVDVLLAGYQDLLKQEALTAQMRKILDVRVSTLKLRGEAKTEFLAMREAQLASAERQKALQAEREEIKQRISEVVVFTAVGTLRTSSIQRGNAVLYRLTDPATGRTIAYLGTNDPKYASLLGQFIGVKGSLSADPVLKMKMIDQPTDAQPVDPSKVNGTIAAQIIPPSLMPGIHASAAPAD